MADASKVWTFVRAWGVRCTGSAWRGWRRVDSREEGAREGAREGGRGETGRATDREESEERESAVSFFA